MVLQEREDAEQPKDVSMDAVSQLAHQAQAQVEEADVIKQIEEEIEAEKKIRVKMAKIEKFKTLKHKRQAAKREAARCKREMLDLKKLHGIEENVSFSNSDEEDE